MPVPVLVALSGGVDSAVSAALLQRDGHDCRAIYLKVWAQELEDALGGCPWEEDVAAASAVASHLSIPFEVWDVSKEYYANVIVYFFAEYAAGRTPNPDILCNSTMKFGILLDRAIAEGCGAVATGHYARLRRAISNLKFHIPAVDLLAGADNNKDQSYFLYQLTQQQLAHALFPIGEYTKPEVRTMAKEFGLPNASRKDSQGICFLGKIPVHEFLKAHVPQQEGVLLNTKGEVVGRHDGAAYVTIGQRHGIGYGGGGAPQYVVAKDVARNIVTVAEGEDSIELFARTVISSNVHWISGTPPTFPLSCTARIRYRQPLAACEVTADDSDGVRAVFSEPQRAVAPGQAMVFYDGDRVLGGAIIEPGER